MWPSLARQSGTWTMCPTTTSAFHIRSAATTLWPISQGRAMLWSLSHCVQNASRSARSTAPRCTSSACARCVDRTSVPTAHSTAAHKLSSHLYSFHSCQFVSSCSHEAPHPLIKCPSWSYSYQFSSFTTRFPLRKCFSQRIGSTFEAFAAAITESLQYLLEIYEPYLW